MNKVILGLLIPFTLTGCNIFKRKTSSSSINSESSQVTSSEPTSSASSSIEKTALDTPTNVYVDNEKYINWDVVSECEKYTVNVNDHEIKTLYYRVSISSIIDDYVEFDTPTTLSISVMANAYETDQYHYNSRWSTPIYYTYTKVTPQPTYPEGSEQNPSKVYTVSDLRNINDHLDWHYLLMNDLVLYDNVNNTGYDNFVPIGIYDVNGETVMKPFSGTFNGGGHTISNLYRSNKVPFITRTSGSLYGCMGLFAAINKGQVSDLTIDNINYTFDNSAENVNKSYLAVGGLAGIVESESVIKRVKVTGNINIGNRASASDNEQYEFIGGICGEAKMSAFTHVASEVNITSIYRYCSVGGIVGIVTDKDVTVKCSYSIGEYSVTSSNYGGQRSAYIGGIIGRVNETSGIEATVQYCYAVMLSAVVKGGYTKSIGGIIAYCTESDIATKVSNNYFYLNGKYDNGDSSEFNEYQVEIDVNEKLANGNFYTPTQFKSGNTIGELHPYSEQAFDGGKQSTYCWVYSAGHYPSLFWENQK